MFSGINNTIKRDNYRWVIWAVCALAFLIVFFHRYALGVVAEDLGSELHLSGTQLGNLISMYFYIYAILQIPAGILADTIGPRAITVSGMIIAGIGSFILGSSTIPVTAYLGRFLVGLGVSGILICILKIQTLWFKPKEFATVLGLTSLVGNSGGILATTPFSLLVMNIGWRSSFYVIGIISILIAGLLWLVVRDKPEDLNYSSVLEHTDENNNIDIKSGLLYIIKDKSTWVNFIILAGIMGTIMSFSGGWGVTYLMHVYDMSNDAAATQVLIFTIGVLIGSPIMGRVADLFGDRKRLIQVGSLVFTVVWGYKVIAMNNILPMYQLPIVYFLAGFFGIFMMLTHAIIKEINPPKFSGVAISVINIAPFVGTVILNFVIGWVLDLTWQGEFVNGARLYEPENYQYAFLSYFIVSLIAFIFSFYINETKRS
ncbi:MFS transporter [Natranaerobius trueperi]|uniref:Major facilitator superfamily (MFS) profile domain-containing protein n=1 Tax=Natranaerobius trueperi TaxID=759412 RepID=A0A226BWH1_9FIRM|nr:MFS transporter [Natranaerobius trueperi]OWZ83346.1 hypothetical protein CDO51_09000 [Natranaerobius trueperi]